MKERFMKNGIYSLEYDKETLKDMVLKLQEENKQLEEQVAYLRRSCERKEETIYEQYDELVGLETRLDKASKYIQEHTFWKLSTSKVLKILKGEK